MTELLRGWQTRGQKTSLNVFILYGVTAATTEKSSKRKPKEVIYFFFNGIVVIHVGRHITDEQN